jgi:hypothetical protein
MDGIGFALEHYDGIGVWRADEAGRRIDATGETTLGDERVTFDGAIALSRTLAARSEVHECVTRQWLAYLTATSVDDRNTEVLTDVLARFGDQRDLRELIVGVVTSRAFTLRQPTDGEVLR